MVLDGSRFVKWFKWFSDNFTYELYKIHNEEKSMSGHQDDPVAFILYSINKVLH